MLRDLINVAAIGPMGFSHTPHGWPVAFLTPAVLLSAVASGIAVVLVTWIADRAGGTITYLLTLYPLWRWQQGKQSERTAHRQEVQAA